MAKKKAAPATKKVAAAKNPGGRRRGAPLREARAMTPAVLAKVSSMWLEGVAVTKIAEAVKVSEGTVRGYIRDHIRPAWERDLQHDRAMLLAKVAHMEEIAWKKFHSKAPAESIRSVKRELVDETDEKATVDKVLKHEDTRRNIFRPGQVAWLQVVQWCLEYRAKIDGMFAPQRHEINGSAELRVAGPRGQVDEEMVKRWKQAVQERLLRAQSLN